MLPTLLLALLSLLLLAALPVWPYSRPWGFYGAGGLALLLGLTALLLHLDVL